MAHKMSARFRTNTRPESWPVNDNTLCCLLSCLHAWNIDLGDIPVKVSCLSPIVARLLVPMPSTSYFFRSISSRIPAQILYPPLQDTKVTFWPLALKLFPPRPPDNNHIIFLGNTHGNFLLSSQT